MLDVSWSERIPGTDDYRTVKPIDRGRLWIDTGFRFNVSVPWWLTWAQSRHDPRFRRASAIHDYRVHVECSDSATAAAELRLILREDGVSAQRAWFAYFGVLFFTAFDDDDEGDKSDQK
jgi:hypothetical protein